MKVCRIIFLYCLIFTTIGFACDLTRPIRFAGNDWDSNSFNTEIARYILETGYACKTQSIQGTEVPLINALVRGDVDINMELWKANNIDIWNKMLKTGRVLETRGVSINKATQSFYIPRYVVFGDEKRGIKPLAPDLRSIKDMKRYYQIFKDPTNPQKGLFYNCEIGLSCETINTKKLNAYGLSTFYQNLRTGSQEALRSEIISALERGKPLFFYYWEPTFLVGKYGKDMMILQEPSYNKIDWQKLMNSSSGEGINAVAYPNLQIHIAVNRKFLNTAPTIATFLNSYYMETDLVNQGLVLMNQSQDLTGRKSAIIFLKTHPDIWKKWVSEDVFKRVQRALNQENMAQFIEPVSKSMLLSAIFAILIFTLLSYFIGRKYWPDSYLKQLIFPCLTLFIGCLCYVKFGQYIFFTVTPDNSFMSFRTVVDQTIDEFVNKYADLLRHSISYPILSVVGFIENFLVQQLSWLFIIALLTALAYHASEKISLTLFVFIGSLFVWAVQLWVPSIQTLVLIFMSILLTILIGLPMGILAGLSNTFSRSLSPILDLMQTMPSFVYLIPVVMLFGLGTFSGVIATAIYAMPPLIRLTSLGINQVNHETLEAAKSFGAKPKDILFKVQLPLALPGIMVGINQAIMMALSMVVIASMIGVGGLGQQVLVGLQQQNIGVGFTSGLVIVFLSIILDRISQAYGNRLKMKYHIEG